MDAGGGRGGLAGEPSWDTCRGNGQLKPLSACTVEPASLWRDEGRGLFPGTRFAEQMCCSALHECIASFFLCNSRRHQTHAHLTHPGGRQQAVRGR